MSQLSPKQTLLKGLLSYQTIALLILGVLLFVSRPQFPKSASTANEGSHLRVRDLVAEENSRQLSFEVNRGQAEPHVKFLSRGRGYSVLLTETRMVIAVDRITAHPSALAEVKASENSAVPAAPPKVLEVSLKGAHSTPEVIGLDQQSGKVNYFVRNDVEKWRTGIPTFGKVLYKGVYPGTDLIYYGKGSNLEYDFHLAPGADPANITLNFKGAETINIDASGDLVLGLTGGEIRERKPDVYQLINGDKKEVAGRFVFKSKHEIGFEVEAYDEAQPLVIDPVLSFATYLGGGDIDFGLDVAVDNNGNSR